MNSIWNRLSGPSKQMNSSLPSYDLQRLFHNIHTTPTTKVGILTPSHTHTHTLTNHLFWSPGERRRESDHRRDRLLWRFKPDHQAKLQQQQQQQHHDRLPPCCRLGGGRGTVNHSVKHQQKQQHDWFGSDADAMSESFSTLRHLFRPTLIFCKHQNETIFDNASFCGEVFIKCHLFWPISSDSIRCEPLYHHVINKPWLFHVDIWSFVSIPVFHDHDHDCLHGLKIMWPPFNSMTTTTL